MTDQNPDHVRDISLAVYLDRLGPDGSARAIKETGIDKIRARAVCMDPLTKAYLRAISQHLAQHSKPKQAKGKK